MKRRLFVIIACLVVFTFLFSACGGAAVTPKDTAKAAETTGIAATAAQENTKPAEKVELVWYLNNQAGEEFITFVKDFVITKFQEAHPNITINMTLNNDPTGIAKQQLAAGEGPDVIALDGPSSLQMFARAGYVMPLDDYSAKYGWDKIYDSWALDSLKRDGKLYGLPEGKEGLVVYYNKKMFTDNGWKVPTTYTEMLDLCAAIKAKGIIPFSFGCSDFRQANEWWVSQAYNLALGREEFLKYLKGEKNWNDPELKDATQKLVDMWKNEYIYKNSGAITIDDAHNLFMTGKAAMKMEGTWAISQLNSIEGSMDWDLFAMPAWKEGGKAIIPMALGAASGINANSKHPDEVAEFLNWYYGPEVGEGMMKMGTFYAMTGIKVEDTKDLGPHVADAYSLLDTAMKQGDVGYCAWTYFPPNVETYLWSNIETLYFGKMKIDDFMNNLQKEFEKDKANDSLFNFGD